MVQADTTGMEGIVLFPKDHCVLIMCQCFRGVEEYSPPTHATPYPTPHPKKGALESPQEHGPVIHPVILQRRGPVQKHISLEFFMDEGPVQ